MAFIRNPIKKSLTTAVAVGVLTLGAAGVSGAAGAPGGSTPPAHHVDCAKAQAHLTHMHQRQAHLSAKVQKLRAVSSRSALNRKGQRRAATMRRNLAHWEKIEAREISAKFLRREAALAAQIAGQCQTGTPAAPASSTASV